MSLQAPRSAVLETAGIRSQTAPSSKGTPTRGGALASPAALSRMVVSTAATRVGQSSAWAVASASKILIASSCSAVRGWRLGSVRNSVCEAERLVHGGGRRLATNDRRGGQVGGTHVTRRAV